MVFFFWTFGVVVVDHAEKLHQLPDEYLADAMPIAKKIAVAQGVENYNILQVGTAFLSTHPLSYPSVRVWSILPRTNDVLHDVE
jgi:hypothetical protein